MMRGIRIDHGIYAILYAIEVSLTFTRSAMTVARFDPSGKYVFIGTSAGTILVFNTRTKIVSFIILTSSVLADPSDDRTT